MENHYFLIKNNIEYLSKLFIYLVFIFFCSNISNTFSLFTIIGILLSNLYSYLSTYVFKFDLPSAFANTRNILISLTTIFIIVIPLFINIYYSFKYKEIIKFLSLLLSILCLFILILFIPNQKKVIELKNLKLTLKNKIHLHHWYYGLFFSLLFRYNNPFSQLLNGFMIGFVISGIAVYGDDKNVIPNLYENKPDTQHRTKPTNKKNTNNNYNNNYNNNNNTITITIHNT